MESEAVEQVRRHLVAADANRRFAQKLLAENDPDFLGWGVTAVFYAALHFSRAHFATHGATAASHQEGEWLFRDYPEISNARVPYKTLKEASENARYYNVRMSAKNVSDALATLGRIENIIVPQTKRRCPDAFKTPPPPTTPATPAPSTPVSSA